MTAKISQKLDVFHQRCLRKLLHITYLDHITNKEVLKRAGSTRLQDIVADRFLTLQRSIAVVTSRRNTQKRSSEEDGRRTFQEDQRRVHISWDEANTLASDKSFLVENCCSMCLDAREELSLK